MSRRRSNPYRESVKGVCGHVCPAWPQHFRNGILTVVCDYCTRAKQERLNSIAIPDVWVVVADGETEVLRRIPTPRAAKLKEATIPLFDPNAEEVPF